MSQRLTHSEQAAGPATLHADIVTAYTRNIKWRTVSAIKAWDMRMLSCSLSFAIMSQSSKTLPSVSRVSAHISIEIFGPIDQDMLQLSKNVIRILGQVRASWDLR